MSPIEKDDLVPCTEVSSTEQVLEQFRIDLVADLRSRGIHVPTEAMARGNCFAAVVAWQRLEHRALATRPRRVAESPELLERTLDPAVQSALRDIRGEFERGENLTHRLTRQFYRSKFNDFLFNNFGIQHLHLGERNAGWDKTKNHLMSGGTNELLFVLVTPVEAYLLDVLDHRVFESVDLTKSLVRIVLRNRPDLLESYVAPGVVGADQTFEDAFALARAGFVTVYELDGAFFLTGGTVLDGRVFNGNRSPCTSTEAIDAANHVLNLVVELVEYVQANAHDLAGLVESESDGTARPAEFKLAVVRAGSLVVLRDECTGVEFLSNGRRHGYRPAPTASIRPVPKSMGSQTALGPTPH